MQASIIFKQLLNIPWFGYHHSPMIDTWVVSIFGLFEAYGAVVKSRGFGITQTWIRVLDCVTLEEFLNVSEPWILICQMGTSQD